MKLSIKLNVRNNNWVGREMARRRYHFQLFCVVWIVFINLIEFFFSSIFFPKKGNYSSLCHFRLRQLFRNNLFVPRYHVSSWKMMDPETEIFMLTDGDGDKSLLGLIPVFVVSLTGMLKSVRACHSSDVFGRSRGSCCHSKERMDSSAGGAAVRPWATLFILALHASYFPPRPLLSALPSRLGRKRDFTVLFSLLRPSKVREGECCLSLWSNCRTWKQEPWFQTV